MPGAGARRRDIGELLRSQPLIGMVHLPPLPGSPRGRQGLDEVLEVALGEARILEDAGLDGLIVENVGDAPFFRESVPAITVAAMAVIVRAVRQQTQLAVGVNMLRNACTEALSVASVTGADFIRCNVVIGAYVTDQGIIQGCAAELARLRRTLDHDVAILGDVHVKHAAPLFDVPIEDAAADLAERGGVDAVIVSGSRSPDPPSLQRVASVKGAVGLPVLIGSGISVANAREYYAASDGLLIGETDFKVDGVWGGRSLGPAYAEAVRLCRAAGR
jgi:membrane complex biogenesis BtpA family protein